MRSNTAAIAAGSGAAYSMNSNPSVPMGLSQGVNFMPLAYPHRELPETAEAHPPVALGRAVELEGRKAGEQPGESNAPFHACDVNAHAHMVAMAERDMAVGLARHVEAV